MAEKPQRIQRRRTKGWRMPTGAIYVGRPTVFGNPWKIGAPHPAHSHPMGAGETVELYRLAFCGGGTVEDRVTLERYWLARGWKGSIGVEGCRMALRGHDLACFCPLDQPCHADVLLEVANA